ncbi:MAG TPA: sugar nucleotide-binding protein [Gemmatimonadales bacterium]|nr:sugar nucleotide-binding protein [Gemmatimonadales bacterium]
MSPRPVRALVVGASGFLGSRLLALAPRDVELAGTGGRRPVRPGNWKELHLDLAAPSAARALVEQERPSTVFFCAYDKSNPAVTVDAAVATARAALAGGARYVLFSTDMVFDGRTGGYSEQSVATPIESYGAMKAEAEALVRAEHPNALVIRTSLLVGESGIMLRPAYECESLMRGRPVSLYRDEWRCPTHVDDVARAAWELAAMEVAGVYHVAGPERLSRLELGRVVCDLFHFDPALIREADRPPSRPRDTSLDCRRAMTLLGWAPRSLSELARVPVAARA